jgi:hypothetical protein
MSVVGTPSSESGGLGRWPARRCDSPSSGSSARGRWGPCLLMSVTAACSVAHPHASAPSSLAAQTRPSGAPIEARCDLGVPRAQITLSDAGDVAFLTYTTGVEDVDTLRRIVAEFATNQNRSGAVAGEGENNQSAVVAGVPSSPPGTTIVLPWVRALAVDVPGGARLELRPVTPALRRLLRDNLREDRLPAGARCPPASRMTPTAPGVRPRG